jgi:hypothetical protein
MFGSGKSVPLKEESTVSLCFGFVWCSCLGVVLLYYVVPLLLPWRFSFAAIFLLGIVLFVEGSIVVSALWPIGKELCRRKA